MDLGQEPLARGRNLITSGFRFWAGPSAASNRHENESLDERLETADTEAMVNAEHGRQQSGQTPLDLAWALTDLPAHSGSFHCIPHLPPSYGSSDLG